jgi:hypothetical protein
MKIILFLLGAALAMAQPVVRAPNDTTVAGLGSAASNRFRVYTVTDGANDSDCTVGGGSTRVICYSSGVTWLNLSGGTGGGAVVAGTGINVAGSTVSIDSAVTATRDIAASGIDNGCLPSGASGTAYTCNPTSLTGPGSVAGKALVAYTQLMPLTFRPDVNCSGSPSTVNVSAQGAKKLFGPDGTTALACTAGQTYSLFYNDALDAAAGAFQQQSGAGGGGGGTTTDVIQMPFGTCNGGMTFQWTPDNPAAIVGYCALPRLDAVEVVASSTQYAYHAFRVPDNWDGATAPDLKVTVFDGFQNATTTVILRAAISCSTTLGSQSYPTDTDSATVTLNGTNYTALTATFTGLTVSSCTAGQMATIRLGRNTSGGGTYTGNNILAASPALIWTVQ